MNERVKSRERLCNVPKATRPENPTAGSQLSRVGTVPFLPLQASSLFRTIFSIFKDSKERVKISYPNMLSLIQDEAQID